MSSLARRFVPIADRVLVQRVKQELKTSGGVLLPETAQPQNQLFAKVVAVGSGRVLKDGTKVDCHVTEGQTVIVSEFGGMKMKLDDEEFMVFRDEDIIAVVRD
jgi:chaperonin GroES